jgi:hypothetical protein
MVGVVSPAVATVVAAESGSAERGFLCGHRLPPFAERIARERERAVAKPGAPERARMRGRIAAILAALSCEATRFMDSLGFSVIGSPLGCCPGWRPDHPGLNM